MAWVLLSLLGLPSILVSGRGGAALFPASLCDPFPEINPVVLNLTSCCLRHRFLSVDWLREVAVLLCLCCNTLMEWSNSVWGQAL